MPGARDSTATPTRATRATRALLAIVASALIGVASCAPVEPTDALVTSACGVESSTCRSVVTVALERLGPVHAPIKRVARTHPRCPPNARCSFVAQDQGAVVIWFGTGEPVMVRVYSERRAGGEGFQLVADVPEPVPPSFLRLIEGAD